MKLVRQIVLCVGLASISVISTVAQTARNEDISARSVQGTVLDPSGAKVQGAAVLLKDTKTLQVRSFITQADGQYHFYGLNSNNDYQLHATHNGSSSPTKTLSVFDDRKKAVIDLKLK
jgi:Carboxypeptidase regulatory-like domain